MKLIDILIKTYLNSFTLKLFQNHFSLLISKRKHYYLIHAVCGRNTAYIYTHLFIYQSIYGSALDKTKLIRLCQQRLYSFPESASRVYARFKAPSGTNTGFISFLCVFAHINNVK